MYEFKVGEFVWFTKSFRQMYWKAGMFREPALERPLRLRVIQVVHTKDGTLYQTKHGHFHQNWINNIVFRTEQEAMSHMQGYKCYQCDKWKYSEIIARQYGDGTGICSEDGEPKGCSRAFCMLFKKNEKVTF